jgi:hypothetical protein
MKYLFIIFLLLTSCFSRNTSSTYNLSSQQELDLMYIVSDLRGLDFVGSVFIKNKEIRNNASEIVNISLSDSIYNVASKYSIIKIVRQGSFVYFVLDGFKGTNYGLLYTNTEEQAIKEFYDISVLKSSIKEPSHKWFFVSSEIY